MREGSATRTQNAELEELLRRSGRGDSAAFSALYDRTSAKLFGVVLRILNERRLGEEVLQDSFVKIWQRAGDYRRDRGTPMTWMITIARNRAIDRLRQLPKGEVGAEDGLLERHRDPARDPLDWAIAGEEAARLRDCLEELDPDPRDCIVLAYMHGLTQQDLAERKKTPLGTIKSWTRRSLAKLRECLSDG